MSAPPCLTPDQVAAYEAVTGLDIASIGLPPSPASLQALVTAHTDAFAWGDLSNWIAGEEPTISHDVIFDKLVRLRRDGWCLEQNSLMHRVLVTIGVQCWMVRARVNVRHHKPLPGSELVWGDRDSHVALIVDAGPEHGVWLLDAGFGTVITAPVALGSLLGRLVVGHLEAGGTDWDDALGQVEPVRAAVRPASAYASPGSALAGLDNGSALGPLTAGDAATYAVAIGAYAGVGSADADDASDAVGMALLVVADDASSDDPSLVPGYVFRPIPVELGEFADLNQWLVTESIFSRMLVVRQRRSTDPGIEHTVKVSTDGQAVVVITANSKSPGRAHDVETVVREAGDGDDKASFVVSALTDIFGMTDLIPAALILPCEASK